MSFHTHNTGNAPHTLALRALRLFFKILPILNTGDFAADILATVHFMYPKLGSFSDMEYYFYQLAYRDSKVPKCFIGLIQMQCSPSFDCNWGKQNSKLAPATPTFHNRLRGWGGATESPNCVGAEGAAPPSNPY